MANARKTASGASAGYESSDEETRFKRSKSADKMQTRSVEKPAKRCVKSEQPLAASRVKQRNKNSKAPKRQVGGKGKPSCGAKSPSDESKVEKRRLDSKERRNSKDRSDIKERPASKERLNSQEVPERAEEKGAADEPPQSRPSDSTASALTSPGTAERTEGKPEKQPMKDDRSEKTDKEEKDEDDLSEVVDVVSVVASASARFIEVGETPSPQKPGVAVVDAIDEETVAEDPREHGFGMPAEESGRGAAMTEKHALDSRPSNLRDVFQDVKTAHLLIIFVVLQMPSYLALAAFSWIGRGTVLLGKLAPKEVNDLGSLVLLGLAAFLVAAFAFDACKAGTLVRLLVRGTAFLLLFVGVLLKGVHTSTWISLLLTLYAGPFSLLGLRTFAKMTERRQFYAICGICFAWTGVVVLTVWVVASIAAVDYTSEYGILWSHAARDHVIQETSIIYRHIYSSRPLTYEADCASRATNFSNVPDAAALKFACERVEIVQLTIWSTPPVVFIFNVSLGIFCLLQARLDLTFDADVVRLIRTIVCVLVFFSVVWYGVTGYLGGVSGMLAKVAWPFMLFAFLALAIFIYSEVKPAVLEHLSEHSTLVKYAHKAYNSNWFRAAACVFWGTMVPVYLALDMLRKLTRHCKQTDKTWRLSTDEGVHVRDHFYEWKWTDILCKIVLLGALGLMLVLGGKLTFVFFSWLNVKLEIFDLAVVCVIVFFVGVAMFMLPPVPGPPIYLFGGFVISDRCPWGFWWGALCCILLCFVLKLTACAVQQKIIGGLMSNSLWVRQTCGVHTPLMRAIERVLRRPGLSFGKVMILCGGPDWPTSVLAGILRISLFQCELGTTPIISSVVTLCLSGSFYLKGDEGEAWVRMGNLMFLLTGVLNMTFWAGLAWAIQDEYEKHQAEITRPREEFVELEWLDYRSAYISERCAVTWSEVPWIVRTLYAFGALMLGIVGYLFFGTQCFGKFELGDSLDEVSWFGPQGLIRPLGVYGLYVAAASFTFLIPYKVWRTNQSRLLVRKAAEEIAGEEKEWKEKRAREAREAAARLHASSAEELAAEEVKMLSRHLSQQSGTFLPSEDDDVDPPMVNMGSVQPPATGKGVRRDAGLSGGGTSPSGLSQESQVTLEV
mmetsp:Transcript_64361/g.186551  ORF Transcript_64361/g.186551 Transcript_64361/m.186551 type:complete len:1122 (+) Transcript_64361:120-3485(+)